MKVLRLTHIEIKADGSGAYCFYPADDTASLQEEISEMQYSEIGEEWKITVEEMPVAEFKALPEFTGW